jgi:putative transposase
MRAIVSRGFHSCIFTVVRNTFIYIGRHRYALVFTTHGRAPLFTDPAAASLVLRQILRSAVEKGFTVTAYCFMEDHLHLLVQGTRDDSDCKAFIKAAKQYWGYYFKQSHGRQLWDRYGCEHVVRDEADAALTIRYLLANPVRAGLVRHPRDYPLLGSQRYSVDELIQIAEYTDDCALE